MKIIKNKFILSIFFITLMLLGVIVFGAKNVSAFEDSYEDNDDFGSAWSVTPGFYPNLYQGDEDWFNISVAANDVLKVSLEFDGDQNNIKLELYNSSENKLDESIGFDNKTVAWISLVPQILYIRIFGENNYDAYNMTIEILVKGTYDDSFEENDDFPQASEIFPNYFNNLVNNDTDIYKLYLDKNVSIDVFNTSALSVGWYNVSYDWLADFSLDDVDDYLILDWNITYTGYYYIVVNGPDLGDFYDIDIWLTGFMGDDWAEENDDLNNAEPIGFGWNGGMVQNDDDWYEVWLEPYDMLEINLFYDTGYTWMNLDLYNENEIHWANGDIVGDHLYLSLTNDETGRFVYIRVLGPNNGDWYDIELILNGMTGDDWAEENDDWNSARDIDTGRHNGLFNFDDDYYRFHLKEGDSIKVFVYCNQHTSMWLEEISSDDGAILNTDSSTDDGFLELNFYADNDQDIIFAVKGDNYGEWYDLEINFDGEGDEKNGEDPFGNFDLSNIPGFPIEIVGSSFILSSLALIFIVKKKKH